MYLIAFHGIKSMVHLRVYKLHLMFDFKSSDQIKHEKSLRGPALTWKRPVSCSGVLMPLVSVELGVSGLKKKKTTEFRWILKSIPYNPEFHFTAVHLGYGLIQLQLN